MTDPEGRGKITLVQMLCQDDQIRGASISFVCHCIILLYNWQLHVLGSIVCILLKLFMDYGAFMQILMIWEYQQQNTYRISVLNPDMNLLIEYYVFVWQDYFCQLILLFSLFFVTIHGSHCIISTNFYLYL